MDAGMEAFHSVVDPFVNFVWRIFWLVIGGGVSLLLMAMFWSAACRTMERMLRPWRHW